jgi:hypothetical protein
MEHLHRFGAWADRHPAIYVAGLLIIAGVVLYASVA